MNPGPVDVASEQTRAVEVPVLVVLAALTVIVLAVMELATALGGLGALGVSMSWFSNTRDWWNGLSGGGAAASGGADGESGKDPVPEQDPTKWQRDLFDKVRDFFKDFDDALGGPEARRDIRDTMGDIRKDIAHDLAKDIHDGRKRTDQQRTEQQRKDYWEKHGGGSEQK